MKTLSAMLFGTTLVLSLGACGDRWEEQTTTVATESEAEQAEFNLSSETSYLGYADDFRLPALATTDAQSKIRLWATWYFLPVVNVVANGFSLRGMDGASLGPTLSLRDWCHSAMEGSVAVRQVNGAVKVYNYAGATPSPAVDCSSIYTHDVSRTKFKLSQGIHGEGVESFRLRPYRTIATDKTVIPWGTAIYVPQARGEMVTLEDGRTIAHDGYFFAGDTGGLIKQNHVDVFIGTATSSPFKWVKSSATGTFDAFVVANPEVVQELRRQAIEPLCLGSGRTEDGCLAVSKDSLAQRWQVGIRGTLTAFAGAGIAEVQFLVDGWSLGKAAVKDERAQLAYTFRAAGSERRLEIIALDSAGAVVRSKQYLFAVQPSAQ